MSALRQIVVIAAVFAGALSPGLAAHAATKFDPRLQIAHGTAHQRASAAGLGAPMSSFRVLIQLAAGASIDDLRASYPSGNFRTAAGPVVTASIPDAVLESLENDARVIRVEGVKTLHPVLDVARSTTTSGGGLWLGTTRNPPAADLANATGSGVVVGIVDTGIDFKHKDFIVPGTNTSRILYLWDQTDAGGPAPSFFGFSCTNNTSENDCSSTEWTQAQLSATIAGSGSARETDTNGHGTHVAGIAAGNGQGGTSPGNYTGFAPQADIIFVKTDFSTDGIIDGVKYIVSRAALLGKPAVINLSLGGQIDVHDGTSPFDVAIGNVAAGTPVAVAMGNDGTGQNHFPHAQAANSADGASVTFNVSVAGAGTFTEIDFWSGSPSSPSNSTYNASISVSGTLCGSENNGSGTDTATTSSPFHCAGQQVYLDNNNVAVGQSGNDTSTANNREIYARVANAGGLPATFTVSITLTCTNGSVCGQLDGFVDPEVEGANFTTGTGYTLPAAMTITSPATANNVFAVGSYSSKTSWKASDNGTYTYDNSTPGNISVFSGWGPTRDGRQKPDVAAPGDVIASSLSSQASICAGCTFENSPGTFSQLLSDGSHAILAGTSMATPVVTGVLATRLQGFPTRTVSQLRTILQTLARSDSGVTTSAAYYSGTNYVQNGWNQAFGAGKVSASPQPVSAPTGLSGTTLGASSITWNWSSTVTAADAYDLYYGSSTSSALALKIQPPFIQTGLSPNSTYTFAAAGEGAGIDGPQAASASVATLSNLPSGISYGAAQNTITVSFTPLPSSPQSASCSGYVLHASTAANFGGTLFLSSTTSSAASNLTLSGLTLNTTYFVRLGSLNTAGAANLLAGGAVVTQATTPSTSSITNVTSSSMQANYGLGGNPPGLLYIVDASTAPDFSGTLVSSQTRNLFASPSPLQANTTYYLRVRTINSGGTPSAPVAMDPVSTLANALAPASPPFSQVAFSSFTAQWTALPASPASSTAEGYVLQASTAADFSGALYLSSTSNISANQLTISSLTVFTNYYARLASVNWSGAPNYVSLGSVQTLFAVSSSSTIGSSATRIIVTPASPQISELIVDIPAGTFPSGSTVTVNSALSSIPAAVTNEGHIASISPGLAFDLSAGGLQPAKPVTLTMIYNPGSLPSGSDVRTLQIGRFGMGETQWTLLPTTVNASENTLVAQTSHFSFFTAFAVTAGAALGDAQIFPIPWEPGSGTAFDAPSLTMSNLPAGAGVKFLTIQGEDVWDGAADAAGTLHWDGTNKFGGRVASGTYLAILEGGGSKKIRRVVVIR